MARPVAIVTGAGSGIGAAIAARLADRYDLILTHLDDDADLQHVLASAHLDSADTVAVTGDLTRSDTMHALADEIERAADRLEVLVSNAGAYPRIPWDTLSVDTFREQIELNLMTHATCAHLVTPLLTARGHGRIITVSSVLTQLGRVDLVPYITAKSGVEGLVRALARELGPHGVTVNCVRAGSIEVPAEYAVVPDHTAMLARQLDRQCVKRRGRPDDIAAAVDFLTSGEAGFITGQCLTIDGGWCMT
ncbi:SDR family NAD(P)-dependent oxidoreductase [Saccharopolyspora endophytica]|uniref:SDR family oxidoreductase n=1 Tax=Saccharopolyspora endophytica TaxID=543886 RepID=A0ABS5DQR1_9PSEU|nr:SDR family oxidoreductase [Saccharopolyspora endophytica]MBQ0928618.1 SDR family oxidoreductase [Saccharopolyspora endophytica]